VFRATRDALEFCVQAVSNLASGQKPVFGILYLEIAKITGQGRYFCLPTLMVFWMKITVIL
jgi:hypothetical protein